MEYCRKGGLNPSAPSIWREAEEAYHKQTNTTSDPDVIEKLKNKIAHLESMRPHWVKGHTSDSVAAQSSYSALSTIWKLLEVENQTQAVTKLKNLLKGKNYD